MTSLGPLRLGSNGGGGTGSGGITKLPQFKAAIARGVGGGTPARILIDGHSWVAGEGSGTDGTGLQGAAALGWAGQLPSKLTALGIPCERHSFWGNYNSTTGGGPTENFMDPRLAQGATWTLITPTMGANFQYQALPASDFFTFTPGFTFSSVTVWNPRQSVLTNAMGVYADGTLVSTINETTGAPHPLTFNTITGLSNTVLSIRNDGTNAHPAYLPGIECFRAGQVSVVTAAGWRGASSANIVLNSADWDALGSVTRYAPDLFIVNSMMNDVTNAVPAATWQANTITLLNALPITSDIAIVIDGCGSSVNFTNGLFDQYVTAAKSIAASYKALLLDFRVALGSTYAIANSAGLMFNTQHPNAAGHLAIAQIVAANLKLAAS